MDKPWREFEKAIAAFIAALGPTAAVSHDAKTPDPDNRRPRQRDVWIRALLFGHFPLTALVSCKRYRRKITAQQVEHFWGELHSARGNLGILYSYSGFTKPALTKAKALGIVCCRFLSNSAPDIPALLTFDSYCFTQQALVEYGGPTLPSGTTWADLFRWVVAHGQVQESLLDVLVARWARLEESFSEHLKAGTASYKHSLETIVPLNSDSRNCTIRLALLWKPWRGRLEAHLLNGSYCENTGTFAGTVGAPIIDLKGETPGPGWEPIDRSEVRLGRNMVQAYLHQADVRLSFLEGLANQVVISDV